MALTVTLYNTAGAAYAFSDWLSFQLKKDVYTPYTTFSVRLLTGGLMQFGTVSRIVVTSGQRVLHEGSLERMNLQKTVNGVVLTLQSYGLTKLLLHSELAPGLYPDISIDTLLSYYYEFPEEVTWEANSDTSNYIYVEENTPIWDGVVTLCYKMLQRYPYIRESNCICLHLPESPRTVRIQPEQTLQYGIKRQYSRMISHFHMQDVEGNYDAYSLVNNQAAAVYQIRHKQIAFDQSYLYDPQQALEFRSRQSQNGWFSQYFTMAGMLVADLNDQLTAEGILEQACISEIVWEGTQEGIRTTLSVYFDAFQNA